jgi:hypothetical protein
VVRLEVVRTVGGRDGQERKGRRRKGIERKKIKRLGEIMEMEQDRAKLIEIWTEWNREIANHKFFKNIKI